MLPGIIDCHTHLADDLERYLRGDPIQARPLGHAEKALRSIGENSQIDAGTTGTLAVNLPPGRYVFFCNLEGHYMGGMHGVLEVAG